MHMRTALRGIGVVLVALCLVGCRSSSSGPTSSKVTFPSLDTSPASDLNNVRTCHPTFPGEIPTDLCGDWGKPVKDTTVTVAATLPRVISLSAPHPTDQVPILPTAGAVARVCSDVTYVNISSVRVEFNDLNWRLTVITPSGEQQHPDGPTGTLNGPIGTATAVPQLAPGRTKSGTECFTLTSASRHGLFLLYCDAPAPGDDAVSVVWRTNL
jgi:hypothetical protein